MLGFGGSTWKVGTATSGPADGLPYLATNPGSTYPNGVDDWVRLPTVDFTSYMSCKIRLTVEVWRNAEKYGLVYYDGGNVQYTTDPAAATGWTAVPAASMGYDGSLDCGAGCLVSGQQVWSSSSNPKLKTGIYDAATPPGSSVTLRFTFHSDSDNTNGPLPGLYVRRVLWEALP
ncbi:Hypothetical protein A7982_11334 [Minicystis rosea]|nr:Hypothetical protein A7982_11334 [Minicystis rosea]